MIWTTDSFQKEFEKLKNSIDGETLPFVFKGQMETIEKITQHWKTCHACSLGFYCCQYETTFENMWLNLIYYSQNHICDNDYKILFTRAKDMI